MGQKVTLQKIYAEPSQSEYGNKRLVLLFNDDSRKYIKMYEQDGFMPIPLDAIRNKQDIDVPICMGKDYAGTTECYGMFSNVLNHNFDGYITTEGDACSSLVFRPGSILIPDEDFINNKSFITQLMYDGKMCKLKYEDYIYDKSIIYNCCLNPYSPGCPEIFNNNYTTTNCDETMISYCKSNINNPKCLYWLEQTVKVSRSLNALQLYSDICANDMSSMACTYFCKSAREGQFASARYCDIALEKYCRNNKSNPNCFCRNTPPILLADLQKFIGPKECWLSECTDKNLDTKYLSTDQLNIRSRCSIHLCNISIDEIKATNTTINMVNNCIGSSENSYKSAGGEVKSDKYPHINFITIIIPIFTLFIILIPLVIYFIYYKRVYLSKKVFYNEL